ncbi:MAG: hypothetical protein KC445_19490, partial [Anaerolineales bacterium]|nr:hypothetical protein [Anaerolineales bacterium]
MNRKIASLFLTTLLAVFLIPALLSLFQQAKVVHAATFTVNTTVDEADGECATDCSIRDAIALAADGDTIYIPTGTYPLSDTLGELSVDKTLIFSGTGTTAADVVLEAGAESRLFGVYDGTSTFYNLTLQNGNVISDNGGAINASGYANLIIINSVITNNQATYSGGGIGLEKGDLTLTNSQVISNSAGSNGGGIYDSNGIITFTNSEVLTNTAGNNGGGIYVQLSNAELIMNGGKINGNTANVNDGFPGGGVYISAGTMTLNEGEVHSNAAFRGGGILVHSSGTLTIN